MLCGFADIKPRVSSTPTFHTSSHTAAAALACLMNCTWYLVSEVGDSRFRLCVRAQRTLVHWLTQRIGILFLLAPPVRISAPKKHAREYVYKMHLGNRSTISMSSLLGQQQYQCRHHLANNNSLHRVKPCRQNICFQQPELSSQVHHDGMRQYIHRHM